MKGDAGGNHPDGLNWARSKLTGQSPELQAVWVYKGR